MERMQNMQSSNEQDTSQYVPKEKDTTPWIVFQGVMAGYDAYGGIRSMVKDNFYTAEYTANIDLKRFILVADYGVYFHGIDSFPRYSYHIGGNFFRVGADANIIYKDPDHNVFSFGLRYGRAKFHDKIYYSVPTSDTTAIGGLFGENIGQTANWLEMNMGMKVKIWKFFWMGYHTRLKFRLKFTPDGLYPFEVPGYGRARNTGNSTWGFNYYVLLRIPFPFGKP